jgi:hypothetical protein
LSACQFAPAHHGSALCPDNPVGQGKNHKKTMLQVKPYCIDGWNMFYLCSRWSRVGAALQ